MRFINICQDSRSNNTNLLSQRSNAAICQNQKFGCFRLTTPKGRDNFMFAGNDAAAQNFAQNMSLVFSCDMNGVNSEAYLADILIRIQIHPAKQIDDLLPHRWKLLFAPSIPNSLFENA